MAIFNGEPTLAPVKSTSKSKSSSRQKEIQLKRLEQEKLLKLEELDIEQEFLDEKYKLLE